MIKLSVVIPTMNSERYIEACLESIFSQECEEVVLEIIVVDGKSNDRTLSKLGQYAGRIAKIISEPDRGIYDAVNKGFSHSSGDIMTWISSNDMFCAGSFAFIGSAFSKHKDVKFLTGLYSIIISQSGFITHIAKRAGISRLSFLDGCHTDGLYSNSSGFIQQEGTFWRRSLWDAIGGNISLDCGPAGDFDLWTRFFQFSEIVCVRTAFAFFRLHEKQVSSENAGQYGEMAKLSLSRMQQRFSHVIQGASGNNMKQYTQYKLEGGELVQSPYWIIDAASDGGILKAISRGDQFS